MNETFRVVVSEIVLPLLATGLVVAAIAVVTNYIWHSHERAAAKRAQGYADQMRQRQPEIAGYATCERCERPCVGYVMRVPDQEPRVHWQHQAPPESSHWPQIVTAAPADQEIVQKLIGEELR
jgi:phosphate/sulfate permease